ncbi:DUF3794 domain-containing protein [Oceanirhabdus sp. W0125-5]|uniref:DUF3794 domain-containing protein n=1 Tax=Oceanirhabdus sp. W0125-5 TaxID=2999116 RepID=UPI0022F2DDFF|nr:DUF3794 domain-containing protein [Oceanirhabdus sp. W0125-5]WBW96632.1 DUF3794 domain-containing protein [Oceanirhabdus sp. W0125-5]
MDCPGNNVVNYATELCPVPDSLLAHFTQLILCDILEIPEEKPDIEFLSNEQIEVIIDNIDVIDVDLGVPDTHKKVVFQGDVKLGVEYSADMPEQEVHFAHFAIPFQGFIGERPCDNDTNKGLISDPNFDLEDYNIRYCLEHVQFHVLDRRRFKPVLVILIWLEPK